MIDLHKEDGLWTVTLNRPDKANSLTEQMLSDLVTIMGDAKDARAVILTGAGKVFSAERNPCRRCIRHGARLRSADCRA